MKKVKIEHYSDKEALDFHTNEKSGKIEINSSKPMTTKRDLALAYSPGVAAPVKAIAENPDLAIIDFFIFSPNWRRERDSNPRDSYPSNTLAGCRFRPLSHLSGLIMIQII